MQALEWKGRKQGETRMHFTGSNLQLNVHEPQYVVLRNGQRRSSLRLSNVPRGEHRKAFYLLTAESFKCDACQAPCGQHMPGMQRVKRSPYHLQ